MFLRIGAIGIAVALSAAQASAQTSRYTFEGWRKLCNDPPAPGCMTTSTARDNEGMVVAEVHLADPANTGPTALRIVLPGDNANRNTPLHIAVDNASPIPVKMQDCLATPKVCYADFHLTAAVAGALKTGKTLRIEAGQQRKVSVVFPLDNYASAIDGKGITVTELRQDMERRAEEARKRLEGR
jgi:invasion protein IalB